jgi:hypothetical protein
MVGLNGKRPTGLAICIPHSRSFVVACSSHISFSGIHSTLQLPATVN